MNSDPPLELSIYEDDFDLVYRCQEQMGDGKSGKEEEDWFLVDDDNVEESGQKLESGRGEYDNRGTVRLLSTTANKLCF
jgi:hypothetical protein